MLWLCPWQVIDLDMSNFGYQTFVVVFSRRRRSGKNENRYSKFKIWHIQINKLPRTFVQSVTHLHECCQDFITLLFTYSNKKAIKNFIFLCTAVSSGQRRHQVLSRANQICTGVDQLGSGPTEHLGTGGMCPHKSRYKAMTITSWKNMI